MPYRWFLGLTLKNKVPHFTTYSKKLQLVFHDKQVIEAMFSQVLGGRINTGLIELSEIFVEGTHIKAAANNHKYINQEVDQH